MNKKIRAVIALLVISIIAGIYYWHHLTTKGPSNNGELTLYGNIDIREVRVAFNGSEHVSEMLSQEGDKIAVGQLLARLETERLQAALDRTRAEVAAAKAEAHSAQLNYQRTKEMASRKLASTAEADIAEAASKTALAHVAATQASMAQSELALNDAKLYAPANGIIRERIVEPGDFVTPQSPIYTLALTNPVWVRTYLPESYLGKVKAGMPARIITDSFPDKSYVGWVGSISPTAEFTPKNVETPDLRTRLVYQVRVFACNPQEELRLGMPVTVTIDLTAANVSPAAETRCTQSNSSSGQK